MSSTEQQPSAFNALGSYADRIKDANGNPTKSTSSPASSAPFAPNGDTIKTDSPSPSATPSSSSSSTVKPRPMKSSSASVETSKETEQDGTWETVKSSRQRPRQQEEKEKHGSNSKNWRDRSHREGQGQGSSQKQKTGDEAEKKGGQGKSHKKHGHQAIQSASATPLSGAATKPATTISAPTKPAWGASTQSAKIAAVSSDTAECTKENGQQSQTVPSSPSLNGTTVTANSVSIPPSIGSPNLSSETASTSTANASVLSKAVDKLEEEGSWRARPNNKVEDTPQPAPQPLQPRQAAPPPAVNAWEMRKKSMAPPATTLASAPAPSSRTPSQAKPEPNQSAKETVQKSIPNGHVKVENTSKHKKKTAARATSSALPPPIHDAALWPDVHQAAEVAKAGEEKKDKAKDRLNNEETSATEESAFTTGTGKKPKWTPIPASELLAAVDQVAENNRRQSRAEANAKKRASASKAENEASGSANKGGKAKKGAVHPGEAKKGGARAGRAGSTSESRSSSIPNKQLAESTAGEPTLEESNNDDSKKVIVNGEVENPLSRQTSKQSKAGSPKKGEQAQLPARNKDASPHLRFGSGPLQSRPMTGSNTAPLPQHGFNHNTNNTLPRVPRGRDGRASFNGRGRGGFRSNSAIAHPHSMHPGFGSPPLGGTSGLPMDGFPNPNANTVPRGFVNLGFQSFYPVQGYGQITAGPGIYDPMQAQYGAGAMYRAGLPPPPMPQTVVPNLDATRFYVLGQIEYYFSMQNLAMDFFLRQQMDSEGWIDISMIASFNRVKSLTPDVSMVKECMALSSLLEVKEESVRLAGPDSSRWVLPDARKSKFANEVNTNNPMSPSSVTEESLSADQSLVSNYDEGVRGISSTAADVENALMKSSHATISAPVTAPAVNGDVEVGEKKEGQVEAKGEELVEADEKKEEV
ncbi:hypothetical protein I203_107288 [Kwoniella mangroviensis CBS 8507]|uniref:hypothetical protein n=1 Tax=Kwoniella mangroviensis CBS 8507 TaxID=1296122 RepID=UPI00080D5C19|nr:uncharacterized protein I203_02032 [Kwoniella mangroviensis CBS 8507]OCF68648.1 hypothetical protein I203_02032 [Kwoniella mangroviensis CBS 8507]